MREFWTKRGIDLSDEQYREAVVNIRTFFKLLSSWDNAGMTTGKECSMLLDVKSEGRNAHATPAKHCPRRKP